MIAEIRSYICRFRSRYFRHYTCLRSVQSYRISLIANCNFPFLVSNALLSPSQSNVHEGAQSVSSVSTYYFKLYITFLGDSFHLDCCMFGAVIFYYIAKPS